MIFRSMRRSVPLMAVIALVLLYFTRDIMTGCLIAHRLKRDYCSFANLVKTILIQRNMNGYIVCGFMIGVLVRLLCSCVCLYLLTALRSSS